MTKWGGLPFGPRRHHIADFHLGIVHDDAINKQFHQLSALSKCQIVERWLDALAKRLNALDQGRHIDMLLSLSIKLPQLLPQAMLSLNHLLASALELLPLDHLCQVEIEQPSLLAFQLREDVTQRLSACVQGLGQPFTPLCPFQFMGDQAGLPQDPAEVLPDECVQGLSRGITSCAALTLGQPQCISAAATEIIMIAGGQGASAACEPALATTDES